MDQSNIWEGQIYREVQQSMSNQDTRNAQPQQAKRPPGAQGQRKRPAGAAAPSAKGRPQNPAGAKPTASGKPVQKSQSSDVPILHGAEALAALVVSEKKHARFQTWVIVLLLLVCLFSLSWNAVQNWTRPEPKLLATTSDGRIQPLPLLDAPIDSRQTLVNWAKRNIPPLYEFNYANYRGALNKNLAIMRPNTLQSFQEMLNQSGILPKVRNEFLILRANTANEPLVLGTDVYDGVRIWIIETPLNLIYESGDVKDGQRERIVQKIVFRSWVARANPMEYGGGLMLAKFSVQPRNEGR